VHLRPGLGLGLVLVAIVLVIGGAGLLVGSQPRPSQGPAPIAGSGQPGGLSSFGPGTPPSAAPASTAVALASPSPPPSSRPSQSPSGPFAMDLYHQGDYVGELTKVWCLPAAMQTSMNIMAPGADVTRKTQARIFALARSLAPAPDGAAEPEGWAEGLTKLGYGNYRVTQQASIKAAIHLAARQVRLTNRPAGLLVWRGAHSWVMSGFTATADPARTDSFVVTAVRIEDVWYPRFSTIWGYSRPPDALVPVSALAADYLPWKRPTGRYPGKDGKFVLVVPLP
jgi:hypothetical protein